MQYTQEEKEIIVSNFEEFWLSIEDRLIKQYPWMGRKKRFNIANIAREEANITFNTIMNEIQSSTIDKKPQNQFEIEILNVVKSALVKGQQFELAGIIREEIKNIQNRK